MTSYWCKLEAVLRKTTGWKPWFDMSYPEEIWTNKVNSDETREEVERNGDRHRWSKLRGMSDVRKLGLLIKRYHRDTGGGRCDFFQESLFSETCWPLKILFLAVTTLKNAEKENTVVETSTGRDGRYRFNSYSSRAEAYTILVDFSAPYGKQFCAILLVATNAFPEYYLRATHAPQYALCGTRVEFTPARAAKRKWDIQNGVTSANRTCAYVKNAANTRVATRTRQRRACVRVVITTCARICHLGETGRGHAGFHFSGLHPIT